jgi:hypothetical protein
MPAGWRHFPLQAARRAPASRAAHTLEQPLFTPRAAGKDLQRNNPSQLTTIELRH